MTEPGSPARGGTVAPENEPKRSRLGQILAERPEARPQIRAAVASLLATALATIAVLGLLLIWHLRRRARMIRERLALPRDVRLPDSVEPSQGQSRQLAGRDDEPAG